MVAIECCLLFLFFIFSGAGYFLLVVLSENVFVSAAIKHPQAPQGAKKVVPLLRARNFFLRMRSAVAGLRQSNSHHRRES